jgi:hypothetical protein
MHNKSLLPMKFFALFCASLFIIVTKAQKNQPQNGLYLTFGSGLATESVDIFPVDIQNNFAWNAGIGYHASINDWFALRFQVNYERTAVEDARYGPPNAVGDRDLTLSERTFTSLRFLVNPVFYFQEGAWQFNFSPGVGIALCNNSYLIYYQVELANGERVPVFTEERLKVSEPFFGIAPFASVSYQVSKSRRYNSWLELGFQPSFWYQLGDTEFQYSSNYYSYMFQLSYTFSFW